MNIVTGNSVSDILAVKLSVILTNAIKNKGHATMVVSGGTTPKQMLLSLFAIKLDWQKVTLYFSDERYVTNTHDQSNHNMVNNCIKEAGLISNPPNLISYFQKKLNVEQAVEILEEKLSLISNFDAVVIGMGLDGHFASLFPDDEQLQEKLSLTSYKNCCSVITKSSPYARISLTLSCLLKTNHFYLLISGTEKLKVLENAKLGLADLEHQVPVTALYQSQIPDNKIQVYCQM